MCAYYDLVARITSSDLVVFTNYKLEVSWYHGIMVCILGVREQLYEEVASAVAHDPARFF